MHCQVIQINNVFSHSNIFVPLHFFDMCPFPSLTLKARKVKYKIASIVWTKSLSWFRCQGSAVNYLISISSHQGCLDACNRDDRCSYYSHLSSDDSHPDHNTCYLFTSEECDMEKLLLDECRCRYSQWRTGKRTTTFSQTYNNLVSGDSDMILSYLK